MEFEGKTAVITGASKGIGQACAVLFAVGAVLLVLTVVHRRNRKKQLRKRNHRRVD